MSQLENKVADIFTCLGQTLDSSLVDHEPLTRLKAQLGLELADLAEISQWISFSLKDLSSEDFQVLSSLLTKQSFLLKTASASVADFAVFTMIHRKHKVSELEVSIRRWYEQVQYSIANNSSFENTFANDRNPTVFRVTVGGTPPISTSESKKPEDPMVNKEASNAKTKAPVDNKSSKPKPEKSASATETKSAELSAEGDDLDPSKLDFRVGVVLKCWDHPESDKLLCEEIDLGEPTGPRSIASGLRAFYSASEVQGRKVLVLANLKERPMAGFKSQGMVLCASNADHTNVRLLEIPDSANVGDRVSFLGFNSEPAQPNQVAKKKILEKLAPGLRTDENGNAHWNNIPFKLGNDEFIKSPIPNAIVS